MPDLWSEIAVPEKTMSPAWKVLMRCARLLSARHHCESVKPSGLERMGTEESLYHPVFRFLVPM